MLFYTSIFVAILMAAVLARFFYAAIASKNKSIPSVEERGWGSSNLAERHPANPVVCHNLKSARHIYEEGLSSMNESYKARRKAESEHLTLDMVSKPFTRKVAPWARDNKTVVRPWKSQECHIKVAEPTYSELTRAKSVNAE